MSTRALKHPEEDNLLSTYQTINLISQVSDQAVENFNRAIAPLGLTPNLARALLILEEPRLSKEIARELRCERSYITRITEELEKRGCITRSTGKDRRQKLICLTPAGAKKRQEIYASLRESGSPIHRLTPEERDSLMELLSKVLKDSPGR